MQVFVLLITLIVVLFSLRLKGFEKLYVYFAVLLFVPPNVFIWIGPLSFSIYNIVTYILLINQILRIRLLQLSWKAFPLKALLLMFFVVHTLIFMFDVNVGGYQKITNPIRLFIEGYSPIFIVFSYIHTNKNVQSVYRFLLIVSLMFAVYGVVNYVLGYNYYSEFFSNIIGKRDFGNNYNGSGRFRISSFSWHALYYGLLVIIFLFISSVNYINLKKKEYALYWVSFGLLVINLFFVNSRTPLLSLFVGILFLLLFASKFKTKLKVLSGVFIVTFLIVIFKPTPPRIVRETLITFSQKGSNLSGSSVDMRKKQLDASLLIFAQSPIWGNGHGYITKVLGYSSEVSERSSDREFEGFESYLYALLIEQGLAGILLNIFMIISVSLFFINSKRRLTKKEKQIPNLYLALFISFTVYIIGTGSLGSFPLMFSILGIGLKDIELRKLVQV